MLKKLNSYGFEIIFIAYVYGFLCSLKKMRLILSHAKLIALHNACCGWLIGCS